MILTSLAPQNQTGIKFIKQENQTFRLLKALRRM